MYVGTFEEIRVFALSGASWTPGQTFSDASVSDFRDFQLSPDGANAYATARDPSAIAAFSVNPADGSLTLIQLITSVPGFLWLPAQIGVTGENVYTSNLWTGNGGLLVFERLPDGTLSYIEEESSVTGALGIVGGGPVEVVGSQVYVGGIEKKIAVFDAVPGGGVDWRGTVDLGTQGSKLVRDIAVSPDGAFLYVSRPDCDFGGPCGGDAIDVLSRDTAAGDLTLVQTLLNGVDISGVAQPRELAVSPDGRWLVVTAAGSGTVTVFDSSAGQLGLPMVQQFDSLLPPFNGGGDLLIPSAVGIDPVTQGVFVASDLDPKIQRFAFTAGTRQAGKAVLKMKQNSKKELGHSAQEG